MQRYKSSLEISVDPDQEATADLDLYAASKGNNSQPDMLLCILGSFSCFCCCLLTFFKIKFFNKKISGTLSECQTVWIQNRTDILSILIWIQTICKVISIRQMSPLARKANITQQNKGDEVSGKISYISQELTKSSL